MSSKRSLSPVDANANTPDPKRARGQHDQFQAEADDEDEATHAVESLAPTQHHVARRALQRSIALVLKHDGFDSATPDALEGFTNLVETYLESIITETTRLAVASRREQPTPTDFEAMLRRFNLPMSSLKPHLRPPIPMADAAPTFANIIPVDRDAHTTLPLLGEELSGRLDKESKHHIPATYPDFPSRHTYSFTPQDDPNLRDSKKTREEAARTAQQGEDALRRLVRASKMRKQKEAKSLVERDDQGRERFRLWELTMRRFMGADGRGELADDVEIADHSMIVNGDTRFSRKELPRQGKRSAMGTKRSRDMG